MHSLVLHRGKRCYTYVLSGILRKSYFHLDVECLEGANPDEKYAYLLRRCRTLQECKKVHAVAAEDAGMDAVPFVATALIQMYGKYGAVEEAKMAFDKVVRKNAFTWNVLITAYAQNGHVEEAKQVFEEMPAALRRAVAWNALLGAFSRSKDAGANEDAFRVFFRMMLEGEKPTRATFLALLGVCATMEEATMVKSHAVETGFYEEMVVATALVNAYGKLGDLNRAREIFEGMEVKNVVAWTAMLGALAQGGADHVKDAEKYFEEMPVRNVVSWNLMLRTYVHNDMHSKARGCFRKMDLEGVEPDRVSFGYILVACVHLEELRMGKVVHESIRCLPVSSLDMEVWNALLDLYGRCGKMEAARQVFDEEMGEIHKCSNTVPWTIMIGNYARNGLENEANDMLRGMTLEGMYPSDVLFISLLAVCTHGGLLEAARGYLLTMVGDYDLEPALEHYMCVVDLLGRMGKLDLARQLVEDMPYEPDIKVWRALMSSSKSHGESEAAVEAAGLALGIDKGEHSPYVMLSNIYREPNLCSDERVRG